MKRKKKFKKKPVEDQIAVLGTQLQNLRDDIATFRILQYAVPGVLVAIVSIVAIFLWVFFQRKIDKSEKRIADIGNEITAIENRLKAMSGEIVPIDSSSNDLIRVFYGTNKTQIYRKNLAEGYLVPLTDIGVRFPLRLKLSGKTLLVDLIFRDLSGALTAEMQENKWQVNDKNFYDRNYDTTGFEVIDREGITKLQIEFLDSATLRIGGVIQDNGNVFFISEQGVTNLNMRKRPKQMIIDRSQTIPRLFRYPSNKHFGIRQ